MSLKFVAALGAVVIASTACTVTTSADSVVGGSSVPAVTDSDVASLSTSGATVEPGEKFRVAAKGNWVIETVSVDGADVQVPTVERVWESHPLPPQSQTRISVTLRDTATGAVHTVRRSLRTGGAAETFTAEVTPSEGSYGVGIIPRVVFSQEIPKASRASVVEQLSVTTSPRPVAGAWRWESGDTVAYRPRGFWPARTKITVRGALERLPVQMSDHYHWGAADISSSLRVARSMLVTIDSKSKSGSVRLDGKVARTFPVSLGKPGYLTRSGIKTLTEKYRLRRMTNLGVTDDEVYDLQVPYAMRITDSGEFLHAAPWNSRIGDAHTSHGCSNLETEDAQWIYDRMLPGDPVITTGTGRPMETWNGPGAAWNVPARQWSRVLR